MRNAQALSKVDPVLRQEKYSVLSREPESSGLLARCGDLGVRLVAHTPLEQGLLTAKFLQEGGGGKADKVSATAV